MTVVYIFLYQEMVDKHINVHQLDKYGVLDDFADGFDLIRNYDLRSANEFINQMRE